MTSTSTDAPVPPVGTIPNGDASRALDGGSVASESTQQTAQTRFSFYNAEDFVTKSPKTAENAQRFSFHTSSASPLPANLHTSAASAPEFVALTRETKVSLASQVPDTVDDAKEILKSLQAHEQQRREILQPSVKSRSTVERTSVHSNTSETSNPYEDAIKDALELLRRHRTGNEKTHPTVDTSEEGLQDNGDNDLSNTQEEVETFVRALEEGHVDDAGNPSVNTASLGEAYQAEIEARRKQRQERMARYANRLAELKQEGGTAGSKMQTFTPKVETMVSEWEERSGARPSTSRSAPMMSHPATTAPNLGSETSSASAEEVQRGVERVLLAILERANSRGRSVRSSSFTEQPDSGDEPLESEEKNSSLTVQADTDEDLLVRAMSDLLGAPSTSSLGSSSPNRNAIQEWMVAAEHEVMRNGSDEEASNLAGPVQVATSNETECPVEEGTRVQDELDEMVFSVLNRDKSMADESAEDSFDKRVRSILNQDKNGKDKKSDGMEAEVEEEGSGRIIPDESEEESQYRLTNEEDETIRSSSYVDESSENDAFNRLEDYSEGEEEEDDEDDEAFAVNEEHRAELDGVLGPLSKKSGGTTGVVLENDSPVGRVKSPTILESLSAAMSLVTGRDNEKKVDKYAPDYTDEEEEEDEEEDDDSDYLEARDLMRSLCTHLLPVGVNQSSKLLDKRPAWDESNPDEPGYRIIRLTLPQLAAVEKAFDRMVTGLKHNSEKKLSVVGTDEAFERDLKAAEELLNQSEKLSSTDVAVPGKTKTKGLCEESEPFEFSKEYGEGEILSDFPGVKPTGRGEMGDLEYFHLPIIFKSHVTGFEPTKDIFLEPGNVVAGQYLVEGELGSAAFSTAYRCVDLSSGEGPDDQEEVCLKVIKNTKDFFDQSLDEIKILELLRQTGKCHEKYIVEMKTFFYHREHLIIVTELLRQNLFEFGKFIIDNDEEPYFTMSRLAYVTRQVLVALEFVHRLGLVHSDVKPENILLSSYSRAQVKLIDFGSSCYLTDRQSSYIQSRSYRAPEVVLGLPYDGRIDIWSLGCVMAEMFTGEVTFQNDSIVSMLSRIEAICGTFPRHMIAQGRQSGRFFAKSGLLFEKVGDEKDDSGNGSDESEDEDASEHGRQHVDIFQPKTTSLSARLGFAPDLMDRKDAGTKLTKEESKQALFVDFVRNLLTIDPDVRPTAREALNHPWMIFADSLTEEDVRYPSS